MAASWCVMQAVSCGSPVGARAFSNNKLLGPCTQRAAALVKFRVRSMADQGGGGRDTSKDLQEKAEPIPQPTLSPPKPKVSSSFFDVLAFSGPGPERINGRLAMIGFVAAMGMEIANGQGLFSQIENGGVAWFVGTSVVLSLASLIPLFRGVSAESKSGSLMTSDAELWNGRFAMLGLVALAFTEYLRGGALV